MSPDQPAKRFNSRTGFMLKGHDVDKIPFVKVSVPVSTPAAPSVEAAPSSASGNGAGSVPEMEIDEDELIALGLGSPTHGAASNQVAKSKAKRKRTQTQIAAEEFRKLEDPNGFCS